jgi:hypothetical protein
MEVAERKVADAGGRRLEEDAVASLSVNFLATHDAAPEKKSHVYNPCGR